MTDPELTVRTIEGMLPELSTKQLQKWHAIFTTATLKIENEMKAVMEHTCTICFFKEYGHRNELPMSWHYRGNDAVCFQHEGDEPFESPQTVEEVPTEQTLEELMELI